MLTPVEVGDRVRLVKESGGFDAGTEGVIFGYYRNDGRTGDLAISIDGNTLILMEDEVELVEPD
jgi:hypothetical protein